MQTFMEPLDSLQMQELLRSVEKPLRTEIRELTEQNRKLATENALLNQHNIALHNCWQNAQVNHGKSQQDLRASIDQVDKLRKEMDILTEHLNPKEVAA